MMTNKMLLCLLTLSLHYHLETILLLEQQQAHMSEIIDVWA